MHITRRGLGRSVDSVRLMQRIDQIRVEIGTSGGLDGRQGLNLVGYVHQAQTARAELEAGAPRLNQE